MSKLLLPLKEAIRSATPYFVTVDENGCSKCGSRRTWTVIGPDGVALGQSWCDKSSASNMAELLNIAYAHGAEQYSRPRCTVGMTSQSPARKPKEKEPMTNKRIKAWITKYALTKGILCVQGEVCHEISSDLFKWGKYDYAHRNEWHLAPATALMRAEEMRQAKIASLRKSLSRMEAMKFHITAEKGKAAK